MKSTNTSAPSWTYFFVLASLAFAPTHAAHADYPDLLVAKTPPLPPREEQKKFHLPPGYRIDLVASEPQIVKPINMKFDSAGRLYVTQSYEYPFPVPEGQRGRDTIRRIVDTDGDGIPETVSVFADGLCIPIGVTPIPGGVFGYSIPYLYRFLDKNADGVSEAREIAYGGFGHRDTHGMINGLNYWLDGWIYCNHGFSNTSTVRASDGSQITMNSGNTFRCRIDGSHVEAFSFGQVNPFGMAFDSRGDAFTADCHSRPATLILRGGYYQSFGKPHDGLGFAPELMEHAHGSTGIGGVVVYIADRFPKADQGTIFLGNPVTGRINHDRLVTHGSTYRAVELADFASCDDPWFRPVDLQLAGDGSIYVADFYNCIIGHYEVPLTHPLRDKTRGRIWRISYAGDGRRPAGPKPVDLSRASPDALFAALGDPNLTVRTWATHELVDRIGQPAIAPARALVESDGRAEARAHAIWVLYRLGAFERALAERLADDRHPLVRIHAVKAIAEAPNWVGWQHALVARKLADADPFVRRAAADSLGRHPDPASIDVLVEAWRKADPADTMLIHVIRIALRNTLGAQSDLQSLADRYRSNEDVERRLLDVCAGIHSASGARLALAILETNPEVGAHPAESIRYVANTLEAERLPDVFRVAARFRGKNRELEREVLLALFRASRERHAPIPAGVTVWSGELVGAFLVDRDAGAVRRGIELAAEARLDSVAPKLADFLAHSPSREVRGQAAEALVRVDPKGALAVIEPLVRSPDVPMSVRCDAVEALRYANNEASRAFLVSLLQIAPARLAAAIVDTLVRSHEGAATLIDAAEKGKCAPRLLTARAIRPRLQAAGLPNLNARLDKLLEGLPAADVQASKLIADRIAGLSKSSADAGRGSAVFQKTCAACHQIGGKGNRVGPNLDGVGNRGPDRLLEDIIDPNRNVDVNFRAVILTLADGQIATGLVLREEGSAVVFVDGKGKEQRIPKDRIEQRTQSKLSPMPANVVDQISKQDLYDLVAYLLQQRAPGEANR